jgi:hypothetical protein
VFFPVQQQQPDQQQPGGGVALPPQNPVAQQQAGQQQPNPMALPALPNVSGFPNPTTGEQNNYAPIPPDEVKRWAELNHVSKGSIKAVEWSQNAGKYVMQMKDGDSEQISPEFIMKNKGHWAPHPQHMLEATKYIIANRAKAMMPQILAARAQQQGGGGPAPAPAAAPPPVMPAQ